MRGVQLTRVTLVPNSRRRDAVSRIRAEGQSWCTRARCCQIFLHHVSPRAPINRGATRHGACVRLKSVRRPLRKRVDYVLAVSLGSAIPRHRSAISTSRGLGYSSYGKTKRNGPLLSLEDEMSKHRTRTSRKYKFSLNFERCLQRENRFVK